MFWMFSVWKPAFLAQTCGSDRHQVHLRSLSRSCHKHPATGSARDGRDTKRTSCNQTPRADKATRLHNSLHLLRIPIGSLTCCKT